MHLLYNLKLILLIFFTLAHSQAPDTVWNKWFNGGGIENAKDIIQIDDDEYIVCGRMNFNIWLLRINSNGDSLWSFSYGEEALESPLDMISTKDSGFVILSEISLSAGMKFKLTKFSNSGDSLWTKTFGGSGNSYARSVFETKDNGFLIWAQTNIFNPDNMVDWLLKTDSHGDTLWTKTYSDTIGNSGRSAIETSKGEYIIAGNIECSLIDTLVSSYPSDLYVAKFDTVGNLLWEKSYGNLKTNDGANSIIESSDSNFIICGYQWNNDKGNYDGWLLKLDNNGDTLWTNTYGDDGWNKFKSVYQTSDKGFILAGTHYPRVHNSYSNGWIVKTDSIGKLIWSETYGWINDDNFESIIQTKDGSYIACGDYEFFDPNTIDAWIMKLTPDGTPITLSENTMKNTYSLNHSHYNSNINISYNLFRTTDVNLSIYNSQGKKIKNLINSRQPAKLFNVLWNVGSISSGVYYYKLDCDQEQIVKSVIVIKQ